MTRAVDDVDVPAVGHEVVGPTVAAVGSLKPVGALSTAAVNQNDGSLVLLVRGQHVLHEHRICHIDRSFVAFLRRIADELGTQIAKRERTGFAAGERHGRKGSNRHHRAYEHIRALAEHS